MGAVLGALPALEGFFTIAVLIGLGWLAARIGLFTIEHRHLLSSMAFTLASPALLYSMLIQADLSRVFTRSAVAAYGAIAVAGLVYLIVSRWACRHDVSGTIIGTFLSAYSNAGNLGIPVAAYALRDVTWIVPILLIQVVLLQPTGLALLDAARARRTGQAVSVLGLVTLPLRNPMTVGVLLGLMVNLVHRRVSWFMLPDWAEHPIDMLGAVAVPIMLLGFGISIRLDPKPAGGADQVESWLVVAIKIVIQPLAAWLLARFALGLDATTVRAVTMIAALPPAQNIFVFASKYGVRLTFTRDTIFRATAVSAVIILILAMVLA